MVIQSTKSIILSGVAALALVACGGDTNGSAGSSDGITLSASGASPLDQPFQLKNGEPLDVDALLQSMEMEGMIAYGASRFDEALGATVLTNVTSPLDETMRIGRIELYGVDAETINTLSAGEAMEKRQKLFTKIRVFDYKNEFSIPAPHTHDHAHFAPHTHDDLQGSISFAAMELNELNIKSPGQEAMAAAEDKQSFAMAAGAIEFAGAALKGFTAHMPIHSQEEGLFAEVQDMQYGEYKEGEFSGLTLRQIDYTMIQGEDYVNEQFGDLGPQAAMVLNSPLRNLFFPEKQRVTVDEINWEGLSFAGLLEHYAKGETPPTDAEDLLSIGGMEILNQSSFINDKELGTVAKTSISPIEFIHFMPKEIKFVSEGATADYTALAGDNNPEITAILEKNGLDNTEGEGQLTYKYDPKDQNISLEADSIVEGLMSLDMKIDIGSFDYSALLSEENSRTEEAAMAITMDHMHLYLEDEKMLDTIFAIAGVGMEQDPATLRQQAVGIISLGALQGGQISPRIPGYATALSTFLNEGGSLKIKIDPENPTSVGSLAAMGMSNPASVLDILNLTVEQE